MDIDEPNYDEAELKIGSKISNRYGNKSIISELGYSEFVNIKATCDEIIDSISEEVIDRTRICGDVVEYTYYLMRSYPYGPDLPYMTILNREKYLDPVDIKPGKLYTMTFKEKYVPYILIDKRKYDRTHFILGSSSLLHMMGFAHVLLYDKDIMPKDHYYGILGEKAMSTNSSALENHSIGLFNAEIVIY
jgi:hypothetical protein